MRESNVAELNSPDGALLESTRAGDRGAYAELWRRHYRSGITVARQFTSLDPDDLVSEAFARIYKKTIEGGGPTGAFRPYLYTSIRNLACTWGGAAARDVQVDEIEDFVDPDTADEPVARSLDRALTVTAYRSLPVRWQTVLWYTEVEGMDAHDVAPILGMTANGVAALAYRAREGLRKAWLQAHVNEATASGACQWVITRLGEHTRHSLTEREEQRLAGHLATCAKCAIVSEEVDAVGSRLALVMLPLLLGGIAGGTLLASAAATGTGAAVTASIAIPALPASIGAASATAGIAGAAGAAGAGAGAGAGASAATSAAFGAAGGASAASGASASGIFAVAASTVLIAAVGVGGVSGSDSRTEAAPEKAPTTQSDDSGAVDNPFELDPDVGDGSTGTGDDLTVVVPGDTTTTKTVEVPIEAGDEEDIDGSASGTSSSGDSDDSGDSSGEGSGGSGGGSSGSGGGSGASALGDTTGEVTKVTTKVTDKLGDTGKTVDKVVDKVVDTTNGAVDDVVDTVDGIVDEVLPTDTTDGSGVVGGLVDDVDGLVGGLVGGLLGGK